MVIVASVSSAPVNSGQGNLIMDGLMGRKKLWMEAQRWGGVVDDLGGGEATSEGLGWAGPGRAVACYYLLW